MGRFNQLTNYIFGMNKNQIISDNITKCLINEYEDWVITHKYSNSYSSDNLFDHIFTNKKRKMSFRLLSKTITDRDDVGYNTSVFDGIEITEPVQYRLDAKSSEQIYTYIYKVSLCLTKKNPTTFLKLHTMPATEDNPSGLHKVDVEMGSQCLLNIGFTIFNQCKHDVFVEISYSNGYLSRNDPMKITCWFENGGEAIAFKMSS